jgi:excisionase family DNA binding protein
MNTASETNNSGLLTVEATAVALGMKVPTIRRWMERRKIAYVKIGARSVRIPQSEIHRIVEAGYVPAAPAHQ